MREQGLPEDFYNDEVHPMMNQNSGNVFLTNSEYQVAMMNSEKLESFYTLSYHGNEGFLDELLIMKQEVKEIPFNGSTLLGIRDENGQVWLVVKKACLDIGLSEGQARRQVENIQQEEPLKLNCRKFAIVQTEGKREISREQLFLHEKVVTLWLAKISLTPAMMKKSPEAYNKLLTYQLEAADVLHKAFYETEEQKSTFNARMGLEGRIEGMQIQINNMENMMCEQMEKLDSVMDNMTLSTRQQQKLYKAAKDRINHLLGGAHSPEYKENAKSYFINLWNGLKALYGCASYKDLNPKYYVVAFDYISTWEYVEV